jgi:general secretion pathway protein E
MEWLKTQEQALAYLRGELSDEETDKFERALAASTELRHEVERSRVLLDLLETASEQSIVRLVNDLLQQAISQGASDIHLVPREGAFSVSFRLDGALREHTRVSHEQRVAVIDRLKVMAACNVLERLLPQEGRIPLVAEGKSFDLRVTFLPTALGERATIRVLSKGAVLAPLNMLGMTPETFAAVQRLTRRPNGFVGVAGPIGSGKTTLLYSMLEQVLKQTEGASNVLTVEDPVEYAMEGLSQTSVDRHRGLDYEAALRAVFRSDPDVVYAAELPDRTAATLAMQMAVTGHLLLSALPAGSALAAIDQLLRLGVEPVQAAQALAGLIGMRLARRTCPHCAEEYQPSPPDLLRLGLTEADGPFRFRWSGCDKCHGGYFGRIGLFEVVEVDQELRRQIAVGVPSPLLWEQTLGQDGRSLLDDARQKVRQGLTTPEEACRVLFDYPHSLSSAVSPVSPS